MNLKKNLTIKRKGQVMDFKTLTFKARLIHRFIFKYSFFQSWTQSGNLLIKKQFKSFKIEFLNS